MLFLKIFDQSEDGWADDARDQGRTYRSALPEPCRWRNWAAYKDGAPQIPATDIIAHVNNVVFPRLKDLPLNGNPAAQQKMREHARTLKQMAREEAQFSSVVRWCLSFRNEPLLLRLAA